MTRPTPSTGIGEAIRLRRLARGWSARRLAERAGLSHTTVSRIENNKRTADNRFILGAIAEALECTVADLAGRPAVTVDPDLAAAEALVPSIRRALMETDPDLAPERPSAPEGKLHADVDLCRALYRRSEYAGLARLLPDLLFDLHADRSRDTLGMSVQMHLLTMATLKHLGHPAEAWIAAERGRDVARMLDDPVALAVSAFSRTCAATGNDGYGLAYAIAEGAHRALSRHLALPRALEALGLLTLRLGFSAAAKGRPGEAADQFREAARIAERTGEAHSWEMCFGPSNVATWQLATETDLGNPEQAVDLSQQVNPATFAAPVRASAFYMDLGRAYAHLRRDREAIRMLLAAEDLAPQRVRSAPLAREAARGMLERTSGTLAGQVRAFAIRTGLQV